MPVKGQGLRFYSDTSKNARNIVLPILLYTPETQFAAGALGVRLWKNIHTEIPRVPLMPNWLCFIQVADSLSLSRAIRSLPGVRNI